MMQYTEWTTKQALRKVAAPKKNLPRVKQQVKTDHQQKMLRISAAEHYIDVITMSCSEHQLAKSLGSLN